MGLIVDFVHVFLLQTEAAAKRALDYDGSDM